MYPVGSVETGVIAEKAHTQTQPFNGPFSGTTNQDFTEARDRETVSGSGISWDICKSATRSRQITMPAPHHSVFTGRKRQSTEGT